MSGSRAVDVDQKVVDDWGFRRLDLSMNVVRHYAWGGEAAREDWATSNKPALLAYMRIKGDRWLHERLMSPYVPSRRFVTVQ